MPILKGEFQENALVNVRNEVRLYFGNSNKVDDRFIDSMINDVVQIIHRRWHPSFTIKFTDAALIQTDGILLLPLEFKKLLGVTNIVDGAVSVTNDNIPDSLVKFRNGIDYTIGGFLQTTVQIDDIDTEQQRRFLRFFRKPAANINVRVHYIRKMRRAVNDSDLVDINEDDTQLVRMGCQFKISIQKGSLEEYDRLRADWSQALQRWVDDDTQPDIEAVSRPRTADNHLIDFELGELGTRDDDIFLKNELFGSSLQ